MSKTMVVTMTDGSTVEYLVGASRNSIGLSWDYRTTDTLLIIDQGEQQTTYPLTSILKWTIH